MTATDTDVDREHLLELRKTVRAWTDQTRKLRTAYEQAADRRAEAMHHAAAAGIPWNTIATDARVTVGTAVRNTHRWNDKTGTPRHGATPKKRRKK